MMARLNLRTRRNKIVAAGAAVLMVAGAGAAYAYWSSLGDGSGTQQNAAGAAPMQVTQDSIAGLTPGGTRALSGKIINAAGPDATVGNVLATVTSVSGDNNPGAIADYWISGTAVVNANVPTGSSGIAWSGLTLHYANSANDQNTGKSAQVNIGYTLTADPVVTGLGHYANAPESGNCYDTTPGNDGPTWAHSNFDEQFQLVKNPGDGYTLNVNYGNGTFVGVDGAISPLACGGTGGLTATHNADVMGAGITGTLAGVWSAQIPGTWGTATQNAAVNACTVGAPCTLTAFENAAFGTSTTRPSMGDFSWDVHYNAGPTHGYAILGSTGGGNLFGSGEIK
jgi:hypothetical protein